MSSSQQQVNSYASLSVSTISEVSVAAVIATFALFIVVLVVYLRRKHYSGTFGTFRPNELVIAASVDNFTINALDPAVLKSIPITIFKSEDCSIECAVCLTELTDGEEARLLPKCNHGFHIECIDMWFLSNSTCPLCRNSVSAEFTKATIQIEMLPLEAAIDERISSSMEPSSSVKEKDMFVIEIPRREMEECSSPSNSSKLNLYTLHGEGIKPPALERLKSMRRILSCGKMEVGSSCIP